ncbi:uncharacterized protein G2W53_005007 [Senna tora]|uniref:Uncharacterized protein n=1 Tax=Senna tora TaxID=362788 RepID=A0A834XCR5_9FABA|nr:uncharacterized protein G2W53_005007 [Senna tora]
MEIIAEGYKKRFGGDFEDEAQLYKFELVILMLLDI